MCGNPADATALSMAWDTVTGSSTSPSSWLVIMSGTVPAALTWASQVCHSPGLASGVKANDGPTMVAPGAMRRISR
jgi:hypothetical protein